MVYTNGSGGAEYLLVTNPLDPARRAALLRAFAELGVSSVAVPADVVQSVAPELVPASGEVLPATKLIDKSTFMASVQPTGTRAGVTWNALFRASDAAVTAVVEGHSSDPFDELMASLFVRTPPSMGEGRHRLDAGLLRFLVAQTLEERGYAAVPGRFGLPSRDTIKVEGLIDFVNAQHPDLDPLPRAP